MSVTGIDMWRTDPFPSPHVTLAPRPLCSECDLCRDRSTCDFACLRPVEERLQRGDVAAFIAEPIQGNGGIAAPPPGYFDRLRAMLDDAGALLIFDEVQCGFGRTGADFRFNALGIEPDILTVAKALGNGFPIGAFCASDRVAAAYTRPGASTTGGNAVSATAARAVLRLMRQEHLPERAARLGKAFRQRLIEIADSCPWCSEIRGDGLMLGMPLVQNGKPLAELTDHVLETMKDKGFLIGKTGPGRNVLTFMPPLVVEEHDLEKLAEALKDTLEHAPETKEQPNNDA
jgi:4-aminobutyrate aminotransferase/4-aminobutyrate aminotransferase/(S)-3-amino-2-methylpropionate transaminase